MNYNKKEIDNVLSLFNAYFKPFKALIKNDFKDILYKEFPEEYSESKDNAFFDKYKGQTVTLIVDGEDYFILEDNNYVLTRDCFYLTHQG